MTTTAEQYFRAYLTNATNNNSRTPQVSQIPTEVPVETLVALATYRPEIFASGVVLQKPTQNLKAIQEAAAKKLQNTGVITQNFGNFTPAVLSGNAIQRRTNGTVTPLSDRDRILRGLDPKTKQLVQQLEDLKALSDLQAKLASITDKLEQQINKFTAFFNALVNAPDALASAALTTLINKLQDLQNAYDKAKAVYELTKKIYNNTKKAILKALFQDLPKAKENLKKGLNVLGKILKLKEIPRIVIYPKFPKLPRMSFSISDFLAKYKKALDVLKKKDNEFHQKAYATAVQQAGFEIVDPNKDKIQRGLTQARNKLREARASLETSQALRTEAVNNARNNLINNIRNVNSTTERERLRIINQYQNAKTKASQAVTTALVTKDNLVKNATATVQATIGEATSAVNTVNTAINAAAQVGASLNSRTLGQQFAANVIQEVTNVNNITNQARVAGSIPTANTSGSITALQYTVDSNTKTVTTTSRRLQPSTAANEAALENVGKAATLGYYSILSVDATSPTAKIVNGVQLFEVSVTTTYASQSIQVPIQVSQSQLQELSRLVSDSIAKKTQVSTPTITTTLPALPKIYRVIGNGANFREEAGLQAKSTVIKPDVPLNLVGASFVSRDGRLWGQFKRIDTGEIGWVANTLITPPPGPFDGQGNLLT